VILRLIPQFYEDLETILFQCAANRMTKFIRCLATNLADGSSSTTKIFISGSVTVIRSSPYQDSANVSR